MAINRCLLQGEACQGRSQQAQNNCPKAQVLDTDFGFAAATGRAHQVGLSSWVALKLLLIICGLLAPM